MKVTVVIDVFRAFTTAAYVLDRSPATYMLAKKHSVITELAKNRINPLVIGKPEIGMDGHIYNIPNSPTRTLGVEVENRDVIHRTEAGALGVLLCRDADLILAASFVNANATVQFIKTLPNPIITLLPMGHEGNTPSMEDTLCAEYINALMQSKKLDLVPYLSELKKGPGSYFFSKDQLQYPAEDFERCLQVDHFNFAIRARLENDFAILTLCK